MTTQNQYQELGISSDKKDVHNAIKNLDKGLFPKAFCKIYPDTFTGSNEHCIIAHADGVGTKASLAYLYWKETGDISALANLAIDAIVMNLDDMLCVGAIGPFTFTQNIDRNSARIPGEVIEAIITATNEYFEKLRRYGINITYNGGETADVNDLVRTLTLNASMQACMKRDDVMNTDIKAGHVIVGLSSFGQAIYEDEYNSGIGSNGLTMGRHKVLSPIYRYLYPETYEELLKEKAYTGKLSVESTLPILPGIPVGKLLLSPTRTYAPIIKDVLALVPHSAISAMIHCSGGGQSKCLGFGANVHIIKDNLFPIPPLFSLIQKSSKETWENMYKTFNMGHRFEIYCDEAVAEKIAMISEEYGVEARLIGRVVKRAKGTKLSIISKHGNFTYTK